MTRTEHDALGPVEVPADRLWGAQTERSRHFFAIGVPRFVWTRPVIRALGLLKKSAALANGELGTISKDRAELIARAADEVIAGALDGEFPLVVFQTGSGTQSNMNANEVIANRANQLAGKPLGSHEPVHPNDHVNKGQSSNDGFPVVMHIVAVEGIVHRLMPPVAALRNTLAEKAATYANVVMIGRTHLQDAVPITLGQEFSGYAGCIDRAADDVERASDALKELNLGATAVGTGLNAGDDYTERALANISVHTGIDVRPAANRFRVTQSMGDVLAYSGAMRRLAVELSKIASDLRLLSSGPRAGLAEIVLPAVQPGSSIMPGKVNPSVPEMVNQVCFQVIGCDAAILAAADHGQLELNVMMPVIAWNGIHATRILTSAMRVLKTRCVDGIQADEERCRELLDRSTALATALSPHIGYAETADIAKTAVATGRSIRDLVRERGLVPDATLDKILSAAAMTTPGLPGEIKGRRGARKTTRGGADSHGAVGRSAGAGRSTAARATVLPGGPGAARGARSRGVSAARADHGRAADRRGKRRR